MLSVHALAATPDRLSRQNWEWEWSLEKHRYDEELLREDPPLPPPQLSSILVPIQTLPTEARDDTPASSKSAPDSALLSNIMMPISCPYESVIASYSNKSVIIRSHPYCNPVIIDVTTRQISSLSLNLNHQSVRSVALAGDHMLTLVGDCGDVYISSVFHPKESPVLLQSQVASVASGAAHSLLVTKRGKLLALGLNNKGQLGNLSKKHTYDNKNTLIPVSLQPLLTVTVAACGFDFSLCIASTGAVYAWGAGSFGQLGLGEWKDCNEPTVIKSLVADGVRCVSVACGDHYSVVLSHEQKVYAWGSNNRGQCGIPNSLQPISMPTCVDGLRRMAFIGTGPLSTFCIQADTGVCWTFGAGNGNKNAGDPCLMNDPCLTGRRMRAVSGGSHHMIAVDGDGNVVVSLSGRQPSFVIPDVTAAIPFWPIDVVSFKSAMRTVLILSQFDSDRGHSKYACVLGTLGAKCPSFVFSIIQWMANVWSLRPIDDPVSSQVVVYCCGRAPIRVILPLEWSSAAVLEYVNRAIDNYGYLNMRLHEEDSFSNVCKWRVPLRRSTETISKWREFVYGLEPNDFSFYRHVLNAAVNVVGGCKESLMNGSRLSLNQIVALATDLGLDRHSASTIIHFIGAPLRAELGNPVLVLLLIIQRFYVPPYASCFAVQRSTFGTVTDGLDYTLNVIEPIQKGVLRFLSLWIDLRPMDFIHRNRITDILKDFLTYQSRVIASLRDISDRCLHSLTRIQRNGLVGETPVSSISSIHLSQRLLQSMNGFAIDMNVIKLASFIADYGLNHSSLAEQLSRIDAMLFSNVCIEDFLEYDLHRTRKCSESASFSCRVDPDLNMECQLCLKKQQHQLELGGTDDEASVRLLLPSSENSAGDSIIARVSHIFSMSLQFSNIVTLGILLQPDIATAAVVGRMFINTLKEFLRMGNVYSSFSIARGLSHVCLHRLDGIGHILRRYAVLSRDYKSFLRVNHRYKTTLPHPRNLMDSIKTTYANYCSNSNQSLSQILPLYVRDGPFTILRTKLASAIKKLCRVEPEPRLQHLGMLTDLGNIRKRDEVDRLAGMLSKHLQYSDVIQLANTASAGASLTDSVLSNFGGDSECDNISWISDIDKET